MKNIKNIAGAVLAFSAVLLFFGCGGKTNSSGSSSAASSSSAAQKTIKVKMTHTGTELTLAHQAFVVIKEYMEKNSNGVFQVDIYPNGQLGNDAQIVEAVQEGDVHLMFTNTGNLISFVPELGVLQVPFAFPSNETAYQVLDGSFGQEMLGMMESKGSMVGLGWLEAVAYRELSAKKQVRVPADMTGIKIRVMTNPIQNAIWENLGAQPTPISFAELYTALQQGTVDAQENPLELFISQRFYEVQKYITLTHHIFTTGMFLANPAWFNKLSPDLQKVVRDATMEGTLFQRKKSAENYDGYLKTLADNGVTVTTLTDEEFNQWKEKASPVNAMIAKEVGGQALIDKLFSAVQAAQK
ncbi:MAG: TRAP transporter substrate-binding protein [Spirochaetaceae bacterium]|jgi:tripartite ATP-independent transporter DctP family solute receptor|nr:TRAP transporter substrate-binding protein [Spirochaetaceae bacterium]